MSHQADATLEMCQNEIQRLKLAYDQLKVEVERLKNQHSMGQEEAHASTPNESEENPKIGSFDMCEVRLPNQPPPKKGTKQVCFASPYPAPPGLPVGLKKLDISSPKGICINPYTTDIKSDHFDITIDTWNNTDLHGAACVWLEFGPSANKLGFQFGRFSTEEDHNPKQPQQITARRINFQRPYSAPPQVVVWLCSFAMGDIKTWRVRTYATDVTKTGFTIHIDTWGDSILLSGAATWIAYPFDTPKIFSGSFNTSELRRWDAPQLHNSGFAKFEGGVFTSPPRIAMAISSLECKGAMRLDLDPVHIGIEGMTWRFLSWCDTTLYSAGGSYIALG